jgi:hypothetical protein
MLEAMFRRYGVADGLPHGRRGSLRDSGADPLAALG